MPPNPNPQPAPDVVLVCIGSAFWAHSEVLSRHSLYFSIAMNSTWTTPPVLNMTDYTSDVVDSVLEWCYTGIYQEFYPAPNADDDATTDDSDDTISDDGNEVTSGGNAGPANQQNATAGVPLDADNTTPGYFAMAGPAPEPLLVTLNNVLSQITQIGFEPANRLANNAEQAEMIGIAPPDFTADPMPQPIAIARPNPPALPNDGAPQAPVMEPDPEYNLRNVAVQALERLQNGPPFHPADNNEVPHANHAANADRVYAEWHHHAKVALCGNYYDIPALEAYAVSRLDAAMRSNWSDAAFGRLIHAIVQTPNMPGRFYVFLLLAAVKRIEEVQVRQ